MESYHFPDEILLDIFSRLPTKSVGKCKCLSKQWHDWLSTSEFIKFHFTRKIHQDDNLILVNFSRSVHVITLPFKRQVVSTTFELQNTLSQVAGSCNGLVLLVSEISNEIFLVNPITRQHLNIPNSQLPLEGPDSPLSLEGRTWTCFSLVGFGYDSFHDDYKIVKYSYYDIEEHPKFLDTCVDVYSLKIGVWKRIDISPYSHSTPFTRYYAPGAFVNGAMHWCANSKKLGSPAIIEAFDLAEEVFRDIPVLIGVDDVEFEHSRLTVVGGCLCLMHSDSSPELYTGIDFWVMKEYGLVDSWTKFISIDVNICCWFLIKPSCFFEDEKVLIIIEDDDLTEDTSLFVYNMKDGSWKNMVVDGVPAKFLCAATFVDSLISPVQHDT